MLHQKGSATEVDANPGTAEVSRPRADLSHPYLWASFMLLGDGQQAVRP